MDSLSSTVSPWSGSSPSKTAGHRRVGRSQRDTLSPEETPSWGLRRKALCSADMWGMFKAKLNHDSNFKSRFSCLAPSVLQSHKTVAFLECHVFSHV